MPLMWSRPRSARRAVPPPPRDPPPRHPPARAAPSRRTEDWEEMRQIGEGGQGKTYIIRLTTDHRRLMVRKTQRDFGMDGNRPREVRILKDILPRHQRINRLVNHAFTPASLLGNRSLVLYFEYYSGGDLSRYISVHNRPSELFIWRIFIQLADALALLHYGYDRYARDPDSIPRGWRRVVHRDIKPENVFLRYIPSTHHPTPNVVLGDFGTATLNESTSETGTAEWKGPEIPLSTAKGDVWGLGAIIHALAHGQGPVDPVPPSDWPMGAAARNTWRTSPRARRPRQLSTRYSDALNRNMMQALELDPNKRVSSRVLVQRLAQDLPRRL